MIGPAAALLAFLLPTVAVASCPDSGTEAPFTVTGAWSGISSVYSQPDGITVMRVRAENGRIDEIAFHRGLLLVAERAAQASYTVDYQGDVDAIFEFEPGAEITLNARQVSADAEQAYTETYVIGDTVPVDIGDCRYDATIIDSFGETADGPLPRVRVYYARALGFSVGREIFYDPEGETPQARLFFETITDDPAALVPR